MKPTEHRSLRMSLLSMPRVPERAHTNGEKQGNQKNFKQRTDSHGRLSWIQIQACLLTLFVEQKGHTSIPGWPKKKKKSSFWIQIQHMCWWSFRQIWENIRPAEAGIWVFPRTLISPNAPSKSIWGADGVVRFLIIWSLSGEKRQVTNPV